MPSEWHLGSQHLAVDDHRGVELAVDPGEDIASIDIAMRVASLLSAALCGVTSTSASATGAQATPAAVPHADRSDPPAHARPHRPTGGRADKRGRIPSTREGQEMTRRRLSAGRPARR
jgi:hypothetical protein